MKDFFVRKYEYWKNVIHGEEYISNTVKFVYLLNACSFVHLLDIIFFGLFGNFLMCLYNIFSFLFYQTMVTVAQKRRYKVALLGTIIEVIIAVVLSSVSFGTCLGFNLFSLALIPMIFYATSILKVFKHPTYVSTGVSFLAAATYIFSLFFTPDSLSEIVAGKTTLAIVVMLFNSLTLTLLITVFLMLFTWEVRNNTATLEKRNQQLKQISCKDPLTKLNNRRSMMEHLNYSMSQMRMNKKNFSVILCDIDNFKKVNDTYGHDCGDKVLVLVSNIISSQMRESDFVCRWGGEEILIKVDGSISVARAIAERIRVNVYGSDVIHDGVKVNVTMTFGVAEANENQRVEDFIQKADSRLYYGKEHGKNQVVIDIPTDN